MRLSGVQAAILGTGGAARALAHGLRSAGARVAVFGRRAERARRLAQEVGGSGGALEDVRGHPQDLLVNATPVGMWPEVDRVPVPAAWVHAGLVYDLVYNPRPTRLLRESARSGSATLDGTAMFLAQAAAQFRIFTGEEAPEAVMGAALEAGLGEGTEP
jgi:shikimate 5-dehydrogenase